MERLPRESLVAALRAHGLRFLAGGASAPPQLSPRELIGQLAAHTEPRLRAALTALFLLHPDWASELVRALEQMEHTARIELQARYMAAVYLQRLWRTRLQFYHLAATPLPDLFSRDLGLPSAEERFGKTGLGALANWQAQQTRQPFNYLASYYHTFELLLGQLRAEAHSRELSTFDRSVAHRTVLAPTG